MSSTSFGALAKAAAALYPARDRFARGFASGKLRGDPVFEHLLREELIPEGARILDLGCGQAVLAALLQAAGRRHDYHGIELMAKDVARANHICHPREGGDAQVCRPREGGDPDDGRTAGWAPAYAGETKEGVAGVTVQGDIRTAPFPAADAVVILDVLHYIEPAAQSDVLRRVRDSLAGGGVLLLRVSDAAPTLRFRYTLAVDSLVMMLRGHRLERLYCRSLSSWIGELEVLGFRVQSRPMSQGTAFANVLLVARYDSR